VIELIGAGSPLTIRLLLPRLTLRDVVVAVPVDASIVLD